MARYAVMLQNVVSTVVEVDAEDPDDAIREAYENGVSGLMFLDHTYPDEGEWQVEDPSTDVWVVDP